jgi:glycosyltransferase involved in cell wall biosynthesis
MHGVSQMTGQLIGALNDIGGYAGHLDTRDPRPHETIGRLDLRNVQLAVRHGRQLWGLLGTKPNAAVYVPVSQGTWGFTRDALLIAVARARRRRVYVHLHGAHLQTFYADAPAPVRWLVRRTLGAVFQAWALTPSLRSVFGGLVPPERVTHLENVVDDIGFSGSRAATDAAPGLPRRVRILYVSNMVPEKNCFELLAALKRRSSELAGCEVRLVGQVVPEIRERMTRECEQLCRLGLSVEAPGERIGDEKRADFAWADVFAYPTQFDGQPLVLLEALAAGLAIVAAGSGGIPDTLRHEREALLFEPGDIDCLADSLVRLAQTPELCQSLGRAARKRYDERYRPARLRADLVRLLARHPTTPLSSSRDCTA